MSHARRSYPARICASGLVTVEVDAETEEIGRVAALRMLDGDEPPVGVRLRSRTVQNFDMAAIAYPADELPAEWRVPMTRLRFGEHEKGRLRWIRFDGDPDAWLTDGAAALCAAGHDVKPEAITMWTTRPNGGLATPLVPPTFGEPNAEGVRLLNESLGVADKYLRLVDAVFGPVEWGWLGVDLTPLVAWKNGDDVAMVMGVRL